MPASLIGKNSLVSTTFPATLTVPAGASDGDLCIIILCYGTKPRASISAVTPPTGFSFLLGSEGQATDLTHDSLCSIQVYQRVIPAGGLGSTLSFNIVGTNVEALFSVSVWSGINNFNAGISSTDSRHLNQTVMNGTGDEMGFQIQCFTDPVTVTSLIPTSPPDHSTVFDQINGAAFRLYIRNTPVANTGLILNLSDVAVAGSASLFWNVVPLPPIGDYNIDYVGFRDT